jgi:tetratricopeptide (TPR) repeat protein
MTIRQGAAVKLSPREQRALASLGYLAGPTSPHPPVAAQEKLPDVKRMLPLFNRVDAAKRLQIAGDAPAAEKLLRELISEAPDYLTAQVKLAAALIEQRKFTDSRQLLEGVLKQDPESSDAYYQLGALYAAQGQFAGAVEAFRKSMASEPKNPVVVLFNLGQALTRAGRLQEAEEAYGQLLDQDPLFVDAHLALADMLAVREGRAPDAEEHYREVLKYAPASSAAHGNLAILLAGQNRLPEAEAHFARAIEHSPGSAELRYQFGTLLLIEGRIDEAVRALEEAVRLDPQHSQARTRLETARKKRAP